MECPEQRHESTRRSSIRAVYQDGSLVVACSLKGLLRLHPSGVLEVLRCGWVKRTSRAIAAQLQARQGCIHAWVRRGQRLTGLRALPRSNRVSPDSVLGPGSMLNYVNDLDIAEDGTIYFSDSQVNI
jgi:hypothetical protein